MSTTDDLNGFRCIAVQTEGATIIITFTKQYCIEEEWIKMLGEELARLPIPTDYSVIVNFERVSTFASAAIGKLIRFTSHMKNLGSTIRFCAVNPALTEVFRIMRLNVLFLTYPCVEKALVSLTCDPEWS
ncbi:MAG: STAS domain-containing protein [Candidatus Peribacteraceae bacterium]|jgi:anti-anti-sigma regulatory factor